MSISELVDIIMLRFTYYLYKRIELNFTSTRATQSPIILPIFETIINVSEKRYVKMFAYIFHADL